ncbi:MAG: sulfurtransferase TusE [Gammaproteobacteria bacterium]|nr:sulfurtransferase TusE [Gammaproteobacteria bacterium]
MIAARDSEGFLKRLKDWNETTAQQIADGYDIALSEAHWQVIALVRNYFNDYGLSPTTRVTVNLLKRSLGTDTGSIYLMKLFGGHPRRTLAQIAGLPKPTDCD